MIQNSGTAGMLAARNENQGDASWRVIPHGRRESGEVKGEREAAIMSTCEDEPILDLTPVGPEYRDRDNTINAARLAVRRERLTKEINRRANALAEENVALRKRPTMEDFRAAVKERCRDLQDEIEQLAIDEALHEVNTKTKSE
jgi:hypothetical protein